MFDLVTRSAAGAAHSAMVAAGPPQFASATLVFHTVLVQLALVVAVILLRIPRAFARLWSASEWTRGHFLGYKPFISALSPPSHPFLAAKAISSVNMTGIPTRGSRRWSYDSYYDVAKPSSVFPMVGAPKSPCPPPLKPAPSFLRPVVSVLRSRVVSGLSVTQMILCVAYLNVLLYPSLYMSTGPFVDYNRFGYISVSQVPFVVALATKNNILGMLLGKGYEKLNFLHRFAGILAIATANIHGLGYVYNWCIQQTFIERISQPSNYLGLGALIAFDGLLLSSRGYLRRNAHTLFLFSHIFFFVALVVLGVLHNPGLVPYLSATSAIYLLDRLMRIAKTRITTASIRAIPEFGATRVELPYINHGWRPGQHVRLRILSSTMGIVGWTEVHPFTIASQSRGEEGLILICKTRGIWTDKLFTAATNGQWRGVGRNIKVAVEGPYGGSGFVMFHSYSAAMFVAGGSGITFALGAVQELIQHGMRGESRVRVMELIWVVQDAASLRSFVPQLAAMIKQSEHTDLRISVHYTKAIVGCPPMYRDTHPGLLLKAGRPRLLEILEATISHAGNGVQDRCGMIVAVCGPVGLADDVSDAVAQVDHGKVHDIGGIEMHEEAFNM